MDLEDFSPRIGVGDPEIDATQQEIAAVISVIRDIFIVPSGKLT